MPRPCAPQVCGQQHPKSLAPSSTVGAMPARFLTRAQVAEELNISMAQCYALIRRGELGDLPWGEPLVVIVRAVVTRWYLRGDRVALAARSVPRRSASASTCSRLKEAPRLPVEVRSPLRMSLATLLKWQSKIAAACS